MKNYRGLIIMFISLLLLTAGCSKAADIEGDSAMPSNAESDLQSGEVAVTDQMGREITFTSTPQKIVSLSPSNTEVIFALGLAERVIGVTDYCNYPPEAQSKEKVGGFSTPNLERIVEMSPDLILASTIHAEEVPRMESLGLPVLVIESSTLEELYVSIELVALVTGVVDQGEDLIGRIRDRTGAVEEKVKSISGEERVKVYYEVYSDPLMSAGSSTFINEIITKAGGVNIFYDIDETYPQISAEVVAERQPQIILYPDFHGTADLIIEEMTARPGWGNIPAIRDNRVYGITDDAFARPGPRVIEAVEEGAKLFYPELF